LPRLSVRWSSVCSLVRFLHWQTAKNYEQTFSLKKLLGYSRLVHSSFFNMSLTAARIAALRLGYIPDLTSSSSPVKYASGRRTVTSFIQVPPFILHIIFLICKHSLNRFYLSTLYCGVQLGSIAFLSFCRLLIIVGVLKSILCSLQVSRTVLIIIASISAIRLISFVNA